MTADKATLERPEAAIAARRGADPATTYGAKLNAKGLDAILKKSEEATETVIAAKSGERAGLVHETADLWFHCLVLLGRQGIAVSEVLEELERRREIDALESQIVRAQAAVAARQAELVRSAANIQNIEARINVLREAVKNDDIAGIKRQHDDLPNAFHALSQQLHAQQSQSSAPNTNGNGRNGGHEEGEVVEGEFRGA